MNKNERVWERMTVPALYQHAEHSLAYPLLQHFRYPWEALGEIADFLRGIGKTLPSEEYRLVGEDVWIAKSASVSPTAHVTGPCIIGPLSEIRHGAFLRGATLIGESAVVGNSTELKNCILFDGVQVPHYNYIGDSVLGYRAHFGAGAITSNVKGDRTSIVLRLEGESLATERRKFGAMVGDHAEVGCNTVLNPGTVVGVGAQIYPLCSVRGYVPENSIYKEAGRIVPKTERKKT